MEMINTYDSLPQAYIDKGMLESNGIPGSGPGRRSLADISRTGRSRARHNKAICARKGYGYGIQPAFSGLRGEKGLNIAIIGIIVPHGFKIGGFSLILQKNTDTHSNTPPHGFDETTGPYLDDRIIMRDSLGIGV